MARRKVIGISGHRPNRLGGYESDNPTRDMIVAKLSSILGKMNNEPPGVMVIVGMSMGADFWAAHVCIDLEIPFIAAVPFEGQETKWSKGTQEEYRYLLTKAAKVVMVSEGGFEPRKMLIRNEWLVEKSDQVIVVWTGERSGTGHTAYTAFKEGKPLIRLNPETGSLEKVPAVSDNWELAPF